MENDTDHMIILAYSRHKLNSLDKNYEIVHRKIRAIVMKDPSPIGQTDPKNNSKIPTKRWDLVWNIRTIKTIFARDIFKTQTFFNISHKILQKETSI